MQKKIYKELESLGATKDKVAQSLNKLGIKGIPKRITYCPIAKYLNSKGYGDAQVCFDEVIIQGGNTIVEMPKACAEFVQAFDRDEFTELRS